MNAAVYVDFENLFGTLQGRVAPEGLTPKEVALQIVDNLLRRLRARGDALVLGRSYSAFDIFPGNEVAHDLALLGVDPQYVLVGHTGRNSADVQLTLDVARVLFRRQDIERIVIVSGDRDFLPLAREVLEVGRELTMCAVAELVSGDLRQRIGVERFVDAMALIDQPTSAGEPPVEGSAATSVEATVAAPEEADESVASAPAPIQADGPAVSNGAAVVVGHIPVTWQASRSSEEREELLTQCLELMMRSRMRHGSDEIWLSPFLKGPMSQHFAHIVHPERRALVNELRNRGVIRVEERENLRADHPYSVIVIDDEHEMARSAWLRLRAPIN